MKLKIVSNHLFSDMLMFNKLYNREQKSSGYYTL